MSQHTDSLDESRNDLQSLAIRNAEVALRMVAVNMPWLSRLTYAAMVRIDDRVGVAAIAKNGLILVNSRVFARLSVRDSTFILAHELLHLALDTFSRESDFDDPQTVNFAHDYIINDLLRIELDMSPPLGGLQLQGASEWSLEKLVGWMREDSSRAQQSWTSDSRVGQGSSLGAMSRALQDAGLLEGDEIDNHSANDPNRFQGDVIFPSAESGWFDESLGSQRASVDVEIKDVVKACLELREADRLSRQQIQGNDSAEDDVLIKALRSHYRPPWEWALQRWLESSAPGSRTFARPSRRGADRNDCVLPGRSREGWTLHIVLDTSGSMHDELSQSLGAIADFCEASGVMDLHLLQCDTQVTRDDWIAIEELDQYRITGLGGSDMSPAMDRLAEDSEVSAVIVITDGWIHYPIVEPPYRVLWAVTSEGASYFEPSYGQVVMLGTP